MKNMGMAGLCKYLLPECKNGSVNNRKNRLAAPLSFGHCATINQMIRLLEE